MTHRRGAHPGEAAAVPKPSVAPAALRANNETSPWHVLPSWLGLFAGLAGLLFVVAMVGWHERIARLESRLADMASSDLEDKEWLGQCSKELQQRQRVSGHLLRVARATLGEKHKKYF